MRGLILSPIFTLRHGRNVWLLAFLGVVALAVYAVLLREVAATEPGMGFLVSLPSPAHPNLSFFTTLLLRPSWSELRNGR